MSFAVLGMIHWIFSPSMDQQKTWFTLNDELCVISPRKLCSNGKFDMFPEEVCRVNIGDLQDKNGGFVHLSWFNKGAKAADTLCWCFFSLYLLEICAAKILEKENFSNQIFSSI